MKSRNSKLECAALFFKVVTITISLFCWRFTYECHMNRVDHAHDRVHDRANGTPIQ